MEETKPRPGAPGDRAKVAAEKLRALRERANQALEEHRGRLAQIESELSLRVRQLAEEFESASAGIEQQALSGRDQELTALRAQLEEGRAKHEKFVEQLALARHQLDAIQAQPCAACQEAANQLADAQGELGRLREQLEAAERQRQEDRQRHEKFAEQISAARQAISDLQSASHEQAAQLQLELEAARAAKAAAEEQTGRLAGDLEALRAEHSALEARADQLEKDRASSLDDLRKTAEADLAAERQRCAALEAELRSARTEHASLLAEKEPLHAQLADAKKQNSELISDREAWQREKLGLEAALAAAKSEALAEQAALTDRLKAAEQKQAELRDRAAAADAERERLTLELSKSADQCQKLQVAAHSAQEQIEALRESGSSVPTLRAQLAEAQAEAKDHAKSRGELQAALEAAKAELTQLRDSSSPRTEFEDLQHKFDLALADLQKLKRENAELREELATRPEASGQESPELVAVRAERDALELRVEELQKAAVAAAGDARGQEEMEDLNRRFEMAVDDVRHLKQENAQLRDQLAKAKPGSSDPGAPGHGGGNDWAAQRARLMAMLEQEEGDGPADAARKKERATIEETIEATDRIVADKDRELAELRTAHQSQTREERAEDNDRRSEEILGADQLIAAERKRLAELQAEWENKLRSAELEFSVERAKLAREQAALKERLFELQKLDLPSSARDNGDGKPRRRWLAALGLGEEGEEGTKAK